MVKYKFGNFEVELDPTDVAFVEKYEAAAECCREKLKSVPVDTKASVTLTAVCQIFFDVFDSLFGKGTSGKMFGKTMSIGLCIKAFQSLVDIANDYQNLLKQITGTNRATKRTRK